MVDFNVLLNKEAKPAQPELYESHAPVQVIDPFDPAPLVELFNRYVAEIDNMDTVALAHEVKDDASCELATTYTTQAKALMQTIDKKHKEVKAPYLTVTRALDSFKKSLVDRLKSTQKIINQKIQPYLQKKEQERREVERKAQEEARKEQERLEAEHRKEQERLAEEARQKALAEKKSEEEAEAEALAAAALAEPPPVVVAEVVTETKTVTDTGTAKLKTEWAWEIEDFKALPDAAFESRKDEVTKALAPFINAQVKAGIRNISGVKVFQTTKIDTRTRR